MDKLHFKTTTKRIKDLMLSPDFNEMTVTEFYPGFFTLRFPNDVTIVVYLAAGHFGNASPHELFYNAKDGHGQTSDKMQITWKFTFAVWNKLTLNNPVLGEHDNSVKKSLDAWARLIQRGYAKCMWDNKTILDA